MISFEDYPCYSCGEKQEDCNSRCEKRDKWFGKTPSDPYYYDYEDIVDQYEKEKMIYTEYMIGEYIRKVISELNSLSDSEFKKMYYMEKDSLTNNDINHIALAIIEKDEAANEIAFRDNFKNTVKDLAVKKIKERIKEASDYDKKKNKSLYERLSRQ